MVSAGWDTRTHPYKHTYRHRHTDTQAHACGYAHTRKHARTHTRTYACTHARARTHAHARTHVHTHTHTHKLEAFSDTADHSVIGSRCRRDIHTGSFEISTFHKLNSILDTAMHTPSVRNSQTEHAEENIELIIC